MREIKFRYYDGKNKIMWKVRSIDFSNRGFVQLESDGKDFVYDCLRCGEELKCYSPFKIIEISELIQYTGLKASGKEIYEGDIVAFKDITNTDRCNEWTAGFGVVKFGEYDCVCDEYSGEAFGFYVKGYDEYKRRSGELDRYSDYKSVLKVTDWEIIGNIYENPKLLK